jgi:hypothetical protein
MEPSAMAESSIGYPGAPQTCRILESAVKAALAR